MRLHQRSANEQHLLHRKMADTTLRQRRLKSRNPLTNRRHGPAPETDADDWATEMWKQRWTATSHSLKKFITEPTQSPPGSDLPRREWVLLNRLRSGYGRFAAFMNKIGLADSGICTCGHPQTGAHVLECDDIGVQGDMMSVDRELCRCPN